MTLTVDWSLKEQPFPIQDISRATGVEFNDIKRMFWSGKLGQAPDQNFEAGKVSAYAVAALFAILECERMGIDGRLIRQAFPELVGSTLVQLQLNEFDAGRFAQTGGTPNLNIKLWSLLMGPLGRDALAAKLPGGAICARRFICFGSDNFVPTDDCSSYDSKPDWQIVDTRGVARSITKAMNGTYFATHIA